MQTDNRFFDDFARLTNGVAGLAAGLRQEIEQVVRNRLQAVIADMDLVPREDFEAVRAMAVKAREEQERMAVRLAEIEAKLAAQQGGGPAPGPHSGPVTSGPADFNH